MIRYPKVNEVLSGKFKEDATESFLLTFDHPKFGGSTEIELSVYTNWTSKLGMKTDKEATQAIKKGLGAIISKHVKHDLVGLEVDKAFNSFAWSVKPFEG